MGGLAGDTGTLLADGNLPPTGDGCCPTTGGDPIIGGRPAIGGAGLACCCCMCGMGIGGLTTPDCMGVDGPGTTGGLCGIYKTNIKNDY